MSTYLMKLYSQGQIQIEKINIWQGEKLIIIVLIDWWIYRYNILNMINEPQA